MSFDIKEHEWDDSQIEVAGTCSLPISGELIFFNHGAHRFAISKSDAIAIAKHFGLIGGESITIFSPDQEILNNTPFPMTSDVNWYDIPNTEVKSEFSHAGEKMAYDHVWCGYWASDKS
jgi:hypothetical protein